MDLAALTRERKKDYSKAESFVVIETKKLKISKREGAKQMRKQIIALGLTGVMMFGMATSAFAAEEDSVRCSVTIDTRALALETGVVEGAGITGPVTTFEVETTDENGNGKIDMMDALITASNGQTNFSYYYEPSEYGGDYLKEIGNQGPDVTDPSHLITSSWGVIQSGWMGSVNDYYPVVSLSLTDIEDGDDLEFRFTITGSYDITTDNYIPGENNDYPALDLKFIDLVDQAMASEDAEIAEIGEAYYETIAAYTDAEGYTSGFFQVFPLVDVIAELEGLLQ